MTREILSEKESQYIPRNKLVGPNNRRYYFGFLCLSLVCPRPSDLHIFDSGAGVVPSGVWFPQDLQLEVSIGKAGLPAQL